MFNCVSFFFDSDKRRTGEYTACAFFSPVCTMYAVVLSLAFFGLVQGLQHRDILDLYKYRYHGNVSD